MRAALYTATGTPEVLRIGQVDGVRRERLRNVEIARGLRLVEPDGARQAVLRVVDVPLEHG